MTITKPSSLYCELIFLAGAKGRKTFTKPHIRIGRQPDNDFVTLDASTSRIHAEIVWDNGIWKIRSLNPANKITVNKQDIQQEAELHHFDEIGLGLSSHTLIRFLAHPHTGDMPNPEMDTTVHIPQPPLGTTLSGAEKKKDEELQGTQDTPWQLVGIILAAVSAIITVYALSPAMFIPGIITILIGMVLCIGVVSQSQTRGRNLDNSNSYSITLQAVWTHGLRKALFLYRRTAHRKVLRTSPDQASIPPSQSEPTATHSQ